MRLKFAASKTDRKKKDAEVGSKHRIISEPRRQEEGTSMPNKDVKSCRIQRPRGNFLRGEGRGT